MKANVMNFTDDIEFWIAFRNIGIYHIKLCETYISKLNSLNNSLTENKIKNNKFIRNLLINKFLYINEIETLNVLIKCFFQNKKILLKLPNSDKFEKDIQKIITLSKKENSEKKIILDGLLRVTEFYQKEISVLKNNFIELCNKNEPCTVSF
jgi:hypothetical protein